MKQHIKLLLDAETITNKMHSGNIKFDRTGDNSIVVSCSGYKHQDLYNIEAELLKLGCKYNYNKDIQVFDKISGRTYTHLIEPK